MKGSSEQGEEGAGFQNRNSPAQFPMVGAGTLSPMPRRRRRGKQRQGVTLVIINRLCLEDLMAVEGPRLRALAAQGGIGLMNTRTGGGLTPENAYTTIGGGVRLVGGAAAKTALPVHGYTGEKAGDIYRRCTGLESPPGSIVVLDIENIKTNNLASANTQRVGVIGEASGRESRGGLNRQCRHP